jgi:hypothetical protein
LVERLTCNQEAKVYVGSNPTGSTIYDFAKKFSANYFNIHWCAWNSALTIIYNLREIKLLSQKNLLLSEQKKQRNFGLIVAVSNLTSLIGFTSYLPVLLKKA